MSDIQDQLLKHADDILSGITNAAKTAGDFAANQLPEIATQYIHLGQAYLTTILILSLIGFIVFVIFTYKLVMEDTPIVILTIIGTLACFSTFILNIKDFLLVWFAPKIWLIQEIVNLIHPVQH